MANEPGSATEAVGETTVTVTEATVPVTVNTDTNEPAADDGDVFDRDRAMHTIRTLRQEVRQYKSQAAQSAALEQRLREIEDAEKTELQKARERAAELEQAHAQATERVRQANLKAAVYDIANDLGLASASLALRAIDRDKLDWDDADAPTNLHDLLTELAEEEPALKAKTARTPRTNATGGAGGQEPPALTAEQLEWAARTGMTPDEYRQAMNMRTLDDWERTRETRTAQ